MGFQKISLKKRDKTKVYHITQNKQRMLFFPKIQLFSPEHEFKFLINTDKYGLVRKELAVVLFCVYTHALFIHNFIHDTPK